MDDSDLVYIDVCASQYGEVPAVMSAPLFYSESIISLTPPALDGHALWTDRSYCSGGLVSLGDELPGALVARDTDGLKWRELIPPTQLLTLTACHCLPGSIINVTYELARHLYIEQPAQPATFHNPFTHTHTHTFVLFSPIHIRIRIRSGPSTSLASSTHKR